MLGVVITMWKGFCGFVPTLQGRLQNCFIGVVIWRPLKILGWNTKNRAVQGHSGGEGLTTGNCKRHTKWANFGGGQCSPSVLPLSAAPAMLSSVKVTITVHRTVQKPLISMFSGPFLFSVQCLYLTILKEFVCLFVVVVCFLLIKKCQIQCSLIQYFCINMAIHK